jgi:hypothetical protein
MKGKSAMVEEKNVHIRLVLNDADEIIGSVVEPGVIEVADKDKVWFHNDTNETVAIVFSEQSLMSKPKDKIEGKKKKDLDVKKVLRGIYPYAVYCEETRDFATASSMPIIIVKR